MNSTYALLAITSLLTMFVRNRKAILVCLLLTNICAFYQGIVNTTGLLLLLGLAAIALLYAQYRHMRNLPTILLFFVLFVAVLTFASHLIPGYANVLAIHPQKISSASSMYSMYLNFDKTMAALLLFFLLNQRQLEKIFTMRDFLQSIAILAGCLMFVVPIGYLLGYIKLDPKLPESLWLWTINNLLFVCVSEEIIFRGFFQHTLQNWWGVKNFTFIPIIAAAIIFGLAHWKGDIAYIILAGICGIFYGYAYFKTKRIFAAVWVHFGLNFVHLLLFTYPCLS